MKKVLFIAYLYPPIANSGTQRSVKFANYLNDYGWKPIVLTVENPPGCVLEPALLNEVRPGMRVERVPFWSRQVAANIASALKCFLPAHRVEEGLEWRLRGAFTIPDSYAMWGPAAVKRALKIFNDEGFDCIYATGAPWTSFLVARAIARLTGRPYVLDYRDPWSAWDFGWDDSSFVKKRISRYLDLQVLNGAAAVISVTGTMVKAIGALKSSKASVFCITNGFEPEEFFGAPTVSNKPDRIRIVYTGVWKSGYSPILLYDALLLLKRNHPEAYSSLDVVCAGYPPGQAEKQQLGDTVQELGRIPHSEAIALMKSADVLFLPVAQGHFAAGMLPGKLFEYLGSERRIIAEVPEVSEVSQVLDSVGGAIRVEPGDAEGLAEVLVDIAHAGGPTWSPPYPDRKAHFERRNLTAQLAEILSLVGNRQGPL